MHYNSIIDVLEPLSIYGTVVPNRINLLLSISLTLTCRMTRCAECALGTNIIARDPRDKTKNVNDVPRPNSTVGEVHRRRGRRDRSTLVTQLGYLRPNILLPNFVPIPVDTYTTTYKKDF
jgi:hypothetical protein